MLAMRIELPDEPNTLGRIATALGGLGANIVHIDVHELDGTDVVDEIVISGPPSLAPGEVRAALLDAGARTVVSVPLAHRQLDALVRALTSLVTFVRDASDDGLLDVVSSVVSVESAAIVHIDDLDDVDPSGRQLRWGTPAARCVDRSWMLAVPRVDRTPTPYDALVVRRAIRFSATEVARLRALLLLHAHLEAPTGAVR
jgi:ACT domain-containing protein